MKVAIFFGGQSREREISFAGGRTVHDILDKALFEPVPIFVDGLGNFILLNWHLLYKGTIRDFYPPTELIPPSKFSVYIDSFNFDQNKLADIISKVGRRVFPQEFPDLFQFAFLVLHGPYGEDGALQGLLDWYKIPYTGTGVLGSAVGINKIVQKRLMKQAGFKIPKYRVLSRSVWQKSSNKAELFDYTIKVLGLPLVVKSPSQGSSIGVSVIKTKNLEEFVSAVNTSLFIQVVTGKFWLTRTDDDKWVWMMSLIDFRYGIGFPVKINDHVIFHPDELMMHLNERLTDDNQSVEIAGINGEDSILIEEYMQGREFSCIILEDDHGKAVPLPPTGILKGDLHFDYRAKYLPGIVRKETPIQLSSKSIKAIRQTCEKLFRALNFEVYARIDGFYESNKRIYLNDPNTTSGMNPSSFFFHQAATIGLTPTQLLTCIIRSSLAARLRGFKINPNIFDVISNLDSERHHHNVRRENQMRIGVMMGGFSAERHISVESGRNVYEKLASSAKYIPVPIFLSGTPEKHRLFIIPNYVMLKDNADDIHMKLLHSKDAQYEHLMKPIHKDSADLIESFASNAVMKVEEVTYENLKSSVDFVFIALHGRPGEDGTVQKILEQHDMPYNGSGVQSTALTMDKYETNKLLRMNGIKVADHMLILAGEWQQEEDTVIGKIKAAFSYPFIAKPVDDGCSVGVVKVKNDKMLKSYARMTFRKYSEPINPDDAKLFGFKPNTEFPPKRSFLIEELIEQKGEELVLEITGGLLTKMDHRGNRSYQVFYPSEVLTTGDVLTLEEKFLAGEGKNFTPPRFDSDLQQNLSITGKVQIELEKTAKVLDIEGYARIDAFVKIFELGQRVETWIIEANSLPGMTPATCIFHQCTLANYTPLEFIEAIIGYGLKRREHSLANRESRMIPEL